MGAQADSDCGEVGLTRYCLWYEDERERPQIVRFEADGDTAALRMARLLIRDLKAAAVRRYDALGFQLRIHRGAYVLQALQNEDTGQWVYRQQNQN